MKTKDEVKVTAQMQLRETFENIAFNERWFNKVSDKMWVWAMVMLAVISLVTVFVSLPVWMSFVFMASVILSIVAGTTMAIESTKEMDTEHIGNLDLRLVENKKKVAQYVDEVAVFFERRKMVVDVVGGIILFASFLPAAAYITHLILNLL